MVHKGNEVKAKCNSYALTLFHSSSIYRCVFWILWCNLESMWYHGHYRNKQHLWYFLFTKAGCTLWNVDYIVYAVALLNSFPYICSLHRHLFLPERNVDPEQCIFYQCNFSRLQRYVILKKKKTWESKGRI